MPCESSILQHQSIRKCTNSLFVVQVSQMEKGHGDTETQLQQAKSEAKKLKDDLTSISTKLKQAQSQIEQLNKAAMKNNASSYQQSIQLESQVLHVCV